MSKSWCAPFSLLFDLIGLARRAAQDKDFEILIQRQQLRMHPRQQAHAPRLSRWEERTLLVRVGKLTGLTASARTQLGHVVLVFKPDTLLKCIANSCAANGPSSSKRRAADHAFLLTSQL